MSSIIDQVADEMTFNHLPARYRFIMFLGRIKYQVLFVTFLVAGFNYWANFLGLMTSRTERAFKKYKKKYVFGRNSEAMTYPSANDTLYQPRYLSTQSTDKLSQLFVQIDREL